MLKQTVSASTPNLPRIVISTGEPAGIGPDIALLAAQQHYQADIITIGDPNLFRERAKQLKLDLKIKCCSLETAPSLQEPHTLKVLPIDLNVPCETGVLNPSNARYVLDVLDLAIDACMSQKASALVTGPIQKSILGQQAEPFTGHTEYLAEKTHSPLPVMMLATEGLRVALATTHVPLRDIPALITQKNIRQTLQILHHDLEKKFGIAKPKILVTGLNPHAGEDGHLGKEEINVIIPVIQALQAQGLNIVGPLPADTLFTAQYLDDADAVLAMYHDQGLPVLKYKGFGNAINVTLGLPMIRTSVDHGTALNIAGTGKASAQSMVLAINTALDMIKL